MHDYYYGAQSEQFSFIRIPTVLFTDDEYRNVSSDAKVLYGILLSRMELSARNHWIDDDGKVFIIFTTEEIMEKLNCGNQKVVKLMAELENECGLIERKRQGQGKPSLIYVKNFLPVDNKVDNSSSSHFLKCENHTSRDVKITSPEMGKSHARYIDNSDIEMSYKENHILSGCDEMGSDEYDMYSSWFREELELDTLIRNDPEDKEAIEGILELLAETCSSKKKEIFIAGDWKPADVVKSRLMKLTAEHIRYVLDCMKDSVSGVRNIKQYLLTSLFNAPVTIDAYYKALVNHDTYGKYSLPRGNPGYRITGSEDYEGYAAGSL